MQELNTHRLYLLRPTRFEMTTAVILLAVVLLISLINVVSAEAPTPLLALNVAVLGVLKVLDSFSALSSIVLVSFWASIGIFAFVILQLCRHSNKDLYSRQRFVAKQYKHPSGFAVRTKTAHSLLIIMEIVAGLMCFVTLFFIIFTLCLPAASYALRLAILGYGTASYLIKGILFFILGVAASYAFLLVTRFLVYRHQLIPEHGHHTA